ncbi:hypothetical protein EMCRGX_G032649 [Ephydatia muelleri]
MSRELQGVESHKCDPSNDAQRSTSTKTESTALDHDFNSDANYSLHSSQPTRCGNVPRLAQHPNEDHQPAVSPPGEFWGPGVLSTMQLRHLKLNFDVCLCKAQ